MCNKKHDRRCFIEGICNNYTNDTILDPIQMSINFQCFEIIED